MKFTTASAIAALTTGAIAAHEQGTFAVLRFNGKQLTKGRMDPSISPGKPSKHVHHIMGGSGFSMSATGEDLLKSDCTNAKINGDHSNYWFPSMYFKDPKNGSIESVDISYVNAYYFFEKTQDDLKAFPVGLKMISGDPDTRQPPANADGKTNLNPDDGDIQPIKWTCPRKDNNYDVPSWPANSDGSEAGIGDPINKGEGVGFPSQHCDGLYSPLRADIHFPSCYNPDAGLDKVGENMAWPSIKDGYHNCPENHVHVPHLFLEVYWDTNAFVDRWTPGSGPQPFVLSNGDATGYSSHADFFAGWEEDVLQTIIDTCDAGTSGMDKCPQLLKGVNEKECTIPSEVDEQVDGVLDALPGGNVLQGWSYGMPEQPAQGEEEELTPPAEENAAAPSTPVEAPAPSSEAHAEQPPVEQNHAEVPPASADCEAAKTVWKTVTVTAGETAPTANADDPYSKKARRNHVHRHRRHH